MSVITQNTLLSFNTPTVSVDCTNGNITLYLPNYQQYLQYFGNNISSVNNSVFKFEIKRIDSSGNTLTITTSATVTNIDGGATYSVSGLEGIIIGFINGSYSIFSNYALGSSVSPSPLTKVDDTNVTLTLGGSPLTALLQATSLTLGWTGTLADSRITSATTWNAKQDALSGTGIVKSTAGTISYLTDNSTNWDTAYTNRITSLTTTGTSGAATLIANTLNIPQYTGGGNETLAQTLALGNTTGGTDISVSAGDDIIITDATASTITFFDASKKLVSADTATYPTITELSYVKGVTSSIQTQLNSVVHEDPVILAYQALGSTIKANAVGLSFNRLATAITLADQNEMYVAVYLPIAQTITGVKWYQGTQGNYTANNYNGVGLYSYSGGTMTLVASSTDDGAIWKATANTIQSKAFSSTYAAVAGIYFVGALWCRSAVVTAPSIYGAVATATLAAGAVDFTNSAKLYSTKAAGTSLPATRLQSATTGTNSQLFFALY